MKIGVLGSGDVAKALGAGFLKHGHEVMMGTRSPAKLADWSRQNAKARLGSFEEAARFAELVVLAVKGSATTEALRGAGAGNLAGKPVIDATNPIADAPPANGVLRFFTSLEDSLMERLQREFPGARFVKAFNSVGSASMVNPQFKGGQPTMFICGNDDCGEEDRDRNPGSVRLGDRRHGEGGGGARHRAALHPLVHPRLPAQRVGARLQAAEMSAGRLRSNNCQGIPAAMAFR